MTPDKLTFFTMLFIPVVGWMIFLSLIRHHHQWERDTQKKVRAVRFKEKYLLLKRLTR